MINKEIGKIIKAYLPQWTFSAIFIIYKRLLYLSNYFNVSKIRKIYNRADTSIKYLTIKELEIMNIKYPRVDVQEAFSEQSLKLQTKYQAKQILSICGNQKPLNILELGCCTGMVSSMIANRGHSMYAIDLELHTDQIDNTGVKFYKMNAESLEFNSEYFDIIYSFASFEHFMNPEKVLNEAYRVLKKNGKIYLLFGPLYNAPFGLHGYGIIGIPYLDILFNKKDIDDFTINHGLVNISSGIDINRWTLFQYRQLWSQFSNKFKIINYSEIKNLKYIDIIEKYPSCFRSKSTDIEEYLVSNIEYYAMKI